MKRMTLAALAGILVSSAAFAQSNPSTNDAATTAQQPQQTQSQSVSPYDQPSAGKTRAEVYQDLVHAEQDGQLATLNRTLYAHH
jgi:uncharacterized protein YdeI (BOF family)